MTSGRLNGLGARPFYSREDKKEAMAKMKLLGIEGLASRNFSRLSGGQQQRVLLARALCAAKRVLVLDEPGNGLDARVRQDLYEILGTSVRALGLTVIMVTHDLRDGEGLANRILHLDNRQVFFGGPEAYRVSGHMAPGLGQKRAGAGPIHGDRPEFVRTRPERVADGREENNAAGID